MSRKYKKRLPKQLYRSKKRSENGFVQLDNRTVRDPDISFAATGMLTYVMSHSDEFDITVELLVKAKRDGKTRVQSILQELLDSGYGRKENG
jgi:hypothetical protein